MTSDAIAAFFSELSSRGREPLLEKATGRARFDVADGKRIERWLVTIDRGDIGVSRRNEAADCVLRADTALFGRVVAGDMNLMAAVMRGEVAAQGDPKFLVLLQRLFPRPGGGRTQQLAADSARRER